MLLTEDQFEEYEKNNAYMYHNHIHLCKVDPKCSIVKVDLVPESLNLHGDVHGGLLYSLADCAAGLASRADGKADYVTQSSYLNFLRSAKEGTIYAKAEEVKRGRNLAIFHISITDSNERLLADGVVDMFRIK